VGIRAGWGPALKDVRVEANHVAGAEVGVGVSVVAGAGTARVLDNRIAGATLAVAALRYQQVLGPDLATDAGAWPQVVRSGNAAS
ncbi:MAG: TIGR03808 family TAT-translocated repetitive protein, partial [Hyphomicrobiales bacterium]|nr:TIGR03808 family TAT-translocated repetitive protein [Hyphomicrobiales bacterium]